MSDYSESMPEKTASIPSVPEIDCEMLKKGVRFYNFLVSK
jgi:hypothetical protein